MIILLDNQIVDDMRHLINLLINKLKRSDKIKYHLCSNPNKLI